MPVTEPGLPLYAADVERTCLPLEQASQLPGVAFTDHDVLEWERANFFRKGWICRHRAWDRAAIRTSASGLQPGCPCAGVIVAWPTSMR